MTQEKKKSLRHSVVSACLLAGLLLLLSAHAAAIAAAAPLMLDPQPVRAIPPRVQGSQGDTSNSVNTDMNGQMGFSAMSSELTADGETLWNMGAFVAAPTMVNDKLANSAHGGYVSTTRNCSVCHSTYRSPMIPVDGSSPAATAASISEATKLLPRSLYVNNADYTCFGCHSAYSAQASSIIVEWGKPHGPHGLDMVCHTCHRGTLHGQKISDFHVMNMFMLGAGSDAQIHTDLSKLARGPNASLWVPGELTGGANLNPSDGAGSTLGNTWWLDGGAAHNAGVAVERAIQIGGLPGEQGGGEALVNACQYAAARGLATSYTCGQEGCHTNSVLANMQWGVGFMRDLDATGSPDTGAGGMATGHALPLIGRVAGSYNGANAPRPVACGPCHVGTPAGFPTDKFYVSRLAYGCDQCHDMVGVATNSTAWPHGNRNILVYEWVEGPGRTQTRVESRIMGNNLWMYGGSIARRGSAPFDESRPEANRPAANAAFGQHDSFARLDWRVIRRNTSGETPSVTAALVTAQAGRVADRAAGSIDYNIGGIDGACLKCHVPIDKESMDAKGSSAAAALMHEFDFKITDKYRTGSQRMFLYR